MNNQGKSRQRIGKFPGDCRGISWRFLEGFGALCAYFLRGYFIAFSLRIGDDVGKGGENFAVWRF